MVRFVLHESTSEVVEIIYVAPAKSAFTTLPLISPVVESKCNPLGSAGLIEIEVGFLATISGI